MVTKSMWWNLISFNVAWFGLVFCGNLFIPVAIVLLGTQLWMSDTDKSDALLILLVAVIGVLLDFALVYAGVFTFPDTDYLPFWLITLWFCFASTIRQSLAFLANSRWFQLFVGVFLAPLSYLAGANLSVVQLAPSLGVSYLLLACLWGPLMLLIFFLSTWLNNKEQNHAA